MFIFAQVSFFCVFLPFDSGDKIALSSMALLGFIFLQTMIMQMVPRQSETSYIEIFIISSTILAAFNVAWSAFVRFVSDNYPRRVTPWVVFVVLRLLAFLLKPGHVTKRLRVRIISRATQLEIQSPENISLSTYFVEAWTYLREFPESDKYYSPLGPNGKPTESEGISEEDAKADALETEDNWLTVGLVLNRLGAAIFIVAQLLVFIFFMMPIYYGIHVMPPPATDSSRTQVLAGDKNITKNSTRS